MKILLDENMPFAFIDFLNEKGHTVEHLKKIGKGGIKNSNVYKYAETEKMWIFTKDSDFKNVLKFETYNIQGVLLFKVSNTFTENLLKLMNLLLKNYSDKFEEKHLIIVEDDGVNVL